MMQRETVLCLDTESLQYPELLGLDGENLLAQPWLRVFTSAYEAREYLKRQPPSEVWVASCDDIDPINSAAAFKTDLPNIEVCLVSFTCTGSLKSRAVQAGLDRVLEREEFIARYTRQKHSRRFHELPQPECIRSDVMRPGNVQPGGIRSGNAQPVGLQPKREQSGGAQPIPEYLQRAARSELLLHVPAVEQPREAVAMPESSRCNVSTMVFESNACAHQAHRGAGLTSGYVFDPVASDAKVLSAKGTRHAYIVPIVSGSGGAGKSTVAVLCSIIAQSKGYKTLLLDLDLQFGDTEAMLGRKDSLCIDEVLDAPAKLSMIQQQENLPSFIAAPRRFERAEEVAAALPGILECLQSNYDVIIANTGGFWAEQHAVLLERSSKTLFLVDQRPSSLCACRRVLELCSRCGIATSPLLFAVNRCAKNSLYSSIDVSCALRGAPAVELRDGGGEVEQFVAAGHPLELLSCSNVFAESLVSLMGDVLPKNPSITAASIGSSPVVSSRKRQRGSRRRSSRRRDASCRG